MLERVKEKLRKGEKIVFVAFGDSITEGYGVEEGWPEKLVKELKSKYPNSEIELINKGKAGDTIEESLCRFEADVLSYEPDLVTINFGINDAMNGVNLSDFEKQLKELIQTIKNKTNSDIIVISSEVLEDETADATARKYYDKLQKVSREEKVAFVDIHRIWQQKLRSGVDLSSLLIPGLDHPNEEGYKIFAKAISELF
ncbi:MAG: SGNH/GDSL hydrolase family protein [Proteobacteria bacterium]|nr:SGNH/GDSL hydrolase family protein [Pseudomonadota bacterium]